MMEREADPAAETTEAGATEPEVPPTGDAVLGRVADPAALDDERNGLAHFETFAPTSWSGRRARLRMPKTLPCLTCRGGGCDGCGRSGAFRLPAEAEHRVIEMDVPRFVKPVVGVRVPRPFGDDSPVKQLLVVVEERSEPDPRIELVDVALVPAEAVPTAQPGWMWIGVAAAVALLAALARLLAG